MSFAENLKQLRKEQHLSQEELAEILDVSRQAVSKWEQGSGYPEVEKLLLLSRQFHISLDSLLSTEIMPSDTKTTHTPGTITITSPHENAIVTCNTVLSSSKMAGGKSSPQYALFAAQDGASSFFAGPPTRFLGWYADNEHVTQEIAEIQNAISQGFAAYTLKYSAKTERKWLKIKIVND